MGAISPDVNMLFDSGHLVFSEGTTEAAYQVLEKHAGRVAHVHLKGIRADVYKKAVGQNWSLLEAVKLGVFTVPGDGMTDFVPIFKILDESGYEAWLVLEAAQDPAKANPFEYAKKAREYIRKMIGI